MGIFGFLFFIIIFFFLLAFTVGLTFLSALFGGFANLLNLLRLGITANRQRRQTESRRERAYSSQTSSSSTVNPASNGKIFGADEGVYVDFEEVKE